jgi:hypothetical protein
MVDHKTNALETFPPKYALTLIGLLGIISQKTELFMAAVVRMSNPATEIRFHCTAKLGEGFCSTGTAYAILFPKIHRLASL